MQRAMADSEPHEDEVAGWVGMQRAHAHVANVKNNPRGEDARRSGAFGLDVDAVGMETAIRGSYGRRRRLVGAWLVFVPIMALILASSVEASVTAAAYGDPGSVLASYEVSWVHWNGVCMYWTGGLEIHWP